MLVQDTCWCSQPSPSWKTALPCHQDLGPQTALRQGQACSGCPPVLCASPGGDVMSSEMRPNFHMTSAGKNVSRPALKSRISALCIFILSYILVWYILQLLQIAHVKVLRVLSQYSHSSDSLWQAGRYLSKWLLSQNGRLHWFCRR